MIAIQRQIHDPPSGARAGGRPLYAIGDIHGCYDLLLALLREIGRDAAERHPGTMPMLVLCGDYIDRGPASSQVLAALAWLTRSSAIEARALEGNHEAMFRLFLENPAEHGDWLVFGGHETLESYGIVAPDGLEDAETLTELRDALLDVMPASHHVLLNRLELMVQAGDYAFVHAGVRPGVPLEKQTRRDLLWIRDEFFDHSRPASSVIIHGHTWIDDQPRLLPHRMGIDTGAYQTGVLTGLRIADDAIEVIQAMGKPSIGQGSVRRFDSPDPHSPLVHEFSHVNG
jgi:serine/threonine protein phosphatase 1